MIFNYGLDLWKVVNTFLVDVNDFCILLEFFSLNFLSMLKVVVAHLFQFLCILLFPFFLDIFLIFFAFIFRRPKLSFGFWLDRLISSKGKLFVRKISIHKFHFPPLLINDDPVLSFLDLPDLFG